MPQKPAPAAADDADAAPPIDAGSASIVFSTPHLPGILAWCGLRDLAARVSPVCRKWDRWATDGDPTVAALWAGAVRACFPPRGPPRWLRHPDDTPRRVLARIRAECAGLDAGERDARRIELRLPPKVRRNLSAWKVDVMDAAEVLGQRCFVRWDLIDACQDEAAIRYRFRFFGPNLYFSAENENALRIGVQNSYYKTWVQLETETTAGGDTQQDDTNYNEGKLAGGNSKEEDVGEKTDRNQDADAAAEQKTVEMKAPETAAPAAAVAVAPRRSKTVLAGAANGELVAVLEGEAYDAFCKWRQRTSSQRVKDSKGRGSLMPAASTFSGSIEFVVLPSVGPPGQARVDYQRVHD